MVKLYFYHYFTTIIPAVCANTNGKIFFTTILPLFYHYFTTIISVVSATISGKIKFYHYFYHYFTTILPLLYQWCNFVQNDILFCARSVRISMGKRLWCTHNHYKTTIPTAPQLGRWFIRVVRTQEPGTAPESGTRFCKIPWKQGCAHTREKGTRFTIKRFSIRNIYMKSI